VSDTCALRKKPDNRQEWALGGVAILPGKACGAYSGGMAHTPLMLSALATGAVPGFQAVSAQTLSTAERDAALVHDVNNDAWLIEISQSDSDAALHLKEIAAARALTEGLRSRLPFRVPSIKGTSDVGGRTLSVGSYLPGSHLAPKAITPVSASSLGKALAALHTLPSSSLQDFDRPHQSALDSLRECAGVVDASAATGLIPQSLLRRWETACEDHGLWQFDTTVIHGQVHLSRFLFENHSVVAVDGWTEFRQGDPGKDLSWLTTPTNSAFATAVHTSYVSSRPSADKWIMQRARFYAELDIAKWLLHGVQMGNDTIAHDATAMLSDLNDRVSSDLDQALTQPISHAQHPLTES